jgi:hypothetical protein
VRWIRPAQTSLRVGVAWGALGVVIVTVRAGKQATAIVRIAALAVTSKLNGFEYLLDAIYLLIETLQRMKKGTNFLFAFSKFTVVSPEI